MFGGNNNQGRTEVNDPVMVSLAVIGLVVLLLAVAWYIWHTELSMVAIFIAYQSLPVLTMIVKGFMAIGTPDWLLNLIVPIDVIKQIPFLRDSLLRQDPRQVDFEFFTLLLSIPGYAFRLFLPLLATGLGIYIYKRSKAARMKRSMNIFSLAKVASESFPQIRPAIIENLFKVDPDSGEFRREESPIRYAIKHGLITTYDIDFKRQNLETTGTPTFDKKKVNKKDNIYLVKDNLAHGISDLHNRCILDMEKTKENFIWQLGQPWTSSQDLPPMVRGIYACLIAFASADKDKAMDLFEQFNRTWKTKKVKKGDKNPILIDLTGVDEVIAKYEKSEHIQKLIGSHAYVTTLFQRLLRESRLKGRISTSLALWLKPVDRTLWYAVNQEGGQCAWSEATGPRAHLIAEVEAKGPLYYPHVETGVEAFEQYLRETEGWIPEEKEVNNG